MTMDEKLQLLAAKLKRIQEIAEQNNYWRITHRIQSALNLLYQPTDIRVLVQSDVHIGDFVQKEGKCPEHLDPKICSKCQKNPTSCDNDFVVVLHELHPPLPEDEDKWRAPIP